MLIYGVVPADIGLQEFIYEASLLGACILNTIRQNLNWSNVAWDCPTCDCTVWCRSVHSSRFILGLFFL